MIKRVVISRIESKNDIKYSFTSPFWLVSSFDILECIVEVDFGIDFSSQYRSRRLSDVLKLRLSVLFGIIRWIIDGK